ncbi:MAG: alpha-L-fucosidase [Asticcacaulis sp.]|uniref:alpha-L-fucosidase n=1 Tax=Asticcacaulis sp. TaxID=1872648 RepID=UPI0039E3BF13
MNFITRRQMLWGTTAATVATATGALSPASARQALAPYGALPSPRQLAWHRKDIHGFVHFTVNTFTDKEWGYGDEPTSVFNPTDFSAAQIVDAGKSAGMTGLVLTAKHHDGFCLWPSAYTEHSIKNSPYKGGKGDIVAEMAQACAAAGLEFGVYLSPWDRNHAEYGRPAYVEYYHNQLNELTTQYGKLFEVWFDGANGGDGYYGGARETRRIDGQTYYQWDTVREIVRKNQPEAVMFADAHMDIRWVGNENGVAGDPCWPTVDSRPYTREIGNHGIRGGDIWNPAETNTSIRPGWFWHADETPRSPANLTKVYFESVGRGTTLLLNLAPDRRGRIPDEDVASLKGWKSILDKGFTTNLARGAKATASSSASSAYTPANVLKAGAFWAADASETNGAWLRIDLPSPQTFDIIQFAEDLRYGVRVDDYAVDIFKDGQWTEISRHTSVGYKRLIRLDAPVTTSRVRLRILTAAASPIMGNFGLFRLPAVVEEPLISRDAQGVVSLKAVPDDLQIYFTVDGTTPSLTSPLYAAPIALPDGGTVKAIAVSPHTGATSAATTVSFDLAPVGWRIVSASVDEPGKLLTGGTVKGQAGQAVELVIDLGADYGLKGFTLKPPSPPNHPTPDLGAPAGFIASVSVDGQVWKPALTGEFSNIAANRAIQQLHFAETINGRYFKLVLPRAVLDRPVVAFDGIGVITR